MEDPQPAAGGGVSNGAVNGEVNVFVIDSRTKEPIANADVILVRGGGAAKLSGTTDANGLTIFSEASLAGAQVIAAAAEGHVPATWYGANGAVVTIPLDPTAAPPAADTATVSGSLTLPRPSSATHVSAGFVLYSFTKNLDAPENKIAQPPGPNPGDPPPNACLVAFVGSTTCNWSLRTRTGTQSHYAVIVDIDTKGTASNADDTFTLIGYAAKTGINLDPDQNVTGEVLTMIAAGDMADLNVTFPASAPTGLGTINAIPILELGDERLLFPLPVLSPTTPSGKLPKTTGVFASGKWTLVAQAKVNGNAPDPQAAVFKRSFDPTQTLVVGDFPSLPTGLAASGGKYSFVQVAGASVHTAEIVDTNAKPVWKALVLDGTKELSIDQTPDPLPAGTLTLKVGMFKLSSFDAGAFAIDALLDSIDGLSSQVTTFQN